MTDSDNQRELQFSNYCRSLLDRSWKDRGDGVRGIGFEALSEYDRETIALFFFNSDYGGNGLADYVAWHGQELLDHTLRGLVCIGASRLAAIVREYYAVLRTHGFTFGESDNDVYEFIEPQPDSVQTHLDDLHAEAADLYADFYSRWWRYHFETSH